MRHFADELKRKNYHLIYVKLDDPNNTGTIIGEIERHITAEIKKLVITEPSEYQQLVELYKLKECLLIPLEILEDNRFLSTHVEFSDWAASRKELRMEFFYRKMGQKYNVLISNGMPEVGHPIPPTGLISTKCQIIAHLVNTM